jgi:hypothetical protein
MTTRAEKYQQRIEAAWEAYCAQLDVIAAEARAEVLLPFCIAKDYYFISGNGTWYIDGNDSFRDGPRLLECTERGRRVLATLALEIPGLSKNDLGSLMEKIASSKHPLETL